MSNSFQPKKSPVELWFIYQGADDYPDKFVVRRWFAHMEGFGHDVNFQVADSLEEARKLIPHRSSKRKLDNTEDDDPVIAEVWV